MPNVAIIYMGKERRSGACEIYRGNQPGSMMNLYAEGWQVDWLYFDTIYEASVRDPESVIVFFQGMDLVIFPRLFIFSSFDDELRLAIATLYSLIRGLGKRIVYETDDDYTNTHREVVAGDAVTPMRWADALTVTTDVLGKRMQKVCKRPFHVLPNCLAPELWGSADPPEVPHEVTDKLVIGLSGSRTHIDDWRVVASPLRQIMTERDDVELWVTGFHPDYLADIPNTRYVDPLPYQHYAQIIRACDIILAPVNHDGFNLGKSPIKATEGMGARRDVGGHPAGAAVIASDNEVYSIDIRDGKTGLLVEYTGEAWYEAMMQMIVDEDRRKAMQFAAYKWAWKRRDASLEWKQWVSAYGKILKSKPNLMTLPLVQEG